MAQNTPQPPRTTEHHFEQEGKSAVIRFTPEDAAWNIFTPDGVYVASFTRKDGEGDDTFELESHRTGPTDEDLVVADTHWPSLVIRALVEAESYEA